MPAKMAKYSLVMTPTPRPCRVAGCIYLLGLLVRTHALMHLLIYLLKQFTGEYKTGNISETVEDRAKVSINGLPSRTLAFDCRQNVYDLE